MSAWVFLLMGLLFTTLGMFPVASILFFWLFGVQMLNRFSPYLPFAKHIHWIYAMSFEVFALTGVIFLRFIPAAKTIVSSGKPILLVHGYLNHGSVWLIQKRRLEALGLGPIYTVHLRAPFGSIKQHAAKVKAKAELIAKETGRKELALIGHSMGGLVSCWYATQMALPLKVTDVITIASPFFGTPVASFSLGKCCREMEINSEFGKELQEAMQAQKTTRFYHIATRTDQLVIPGTSAIFPGHKGYIFDNVGHASLLYLPSVTEKIYEWLEKK